MALTLYYHGASFVLSDDHTDSEWRAIIADWMEHAAASESPIVAWFELLGGGHLSLRLWKDTPLAITSDWSDD